MRWLTKYILLPSPSHNLPSHFHFISHFNSLYRRPTKEEEMRWMIKNYEMVDCETDHKMVDGGKKSSQSCDKIEWKETKKSSSQQINDILKSNSLISYQNNENQNNDIRWLISQHTNTNQYKEYISHIFDQFILSSSSSTKNENNYFKDEKDQKKFNLYCKQQEEDQKNEKNENFLSQQQPPPSTILPSSSKQKKIKFDQFLSSTISLVILNYKTPFSLKHR